MPQAEAAIWNLSRRCSVFSRVRALLTPRRGAVRGKKWTVFLRRRPVRSWIFSSSWVGTARSGEPQRHALRLHHILLPSPGGTLNMLPRALYGDLTWEDALKNTISAPSARMLSGGRVGNKQFFVATIVGAPALWVKARESVREGDIIDVVEKGSVALQNMFETKVRYRISEQINGEAEAVILICPLVSDEMSGSEQALEAAVVDVGNAAEAIRLATAAAFGKWRDDRKILLTKTKRLTVQSSKEIPATLDGESVNLGTHAQIDFVSGVLTVLVPGK